MNEFVIDLTELVDPPHTDSISGREFGEQHAKDTKLLEHVLLEEKIIISVNSKFVKAINDSFIKGFFSKIFEKLHTVDEVKKHFELRVDDNYKRLFEKNWIILQSINNV